MFFIFENQSSRFLRSSRTSMFFFDLGFIRG